MQFYRIHFNIYNINEVIIQKFLHQWMNKLLSEENQVPEEDRQVAGSATYKHSETV